MPLKLESIQSNIQTFSFLLFTHHQMDKNHQDSFDKPGDNILISIVKFLRHPY